MKIRIYLPIMAVICLFVLFACKNEKNPNQLIAGDNNKTWYPTKETNASGDKEKLTSDEKEESWVFYNNGTMSMNLTNMSQNGKWSYSEADKSLTMTPDGSAVSMGFKVEELTDNTMKLQAPDGSELKLKAE